MNNYFAQFLSKHPRAANYVTPAAPLAHAERDIEKQDASPAGGPSPQAVQSSASVFANDYDDEELFIVPKEQEGLQPVSGGPPTPQRRKLEKNKNDDDEVDELALLLGSQEARRQVQQQHQTTGATESAKQQLGSTVLTSHSLPSPIAISALPWSSRRRADLRHVAYLFTLQLESELLRDPDLLDAFRPFLKERFMEKIARSLVHEEITAMYPLLTHPLYLPKDAWDDDGDENPYRHVVPPFSLFLAPPPVTEELLSASSSTGPSTSHSQGHGSFVLRDYQRDGVFFLLNHFHRGISCVLSDDMGLGKTAQVASFLRLLLSLHGIRGPHLIVCPLTTLANWMRELSRWAPELHVMKCHGGRSERSRQRIGRTTGVVVTTPAILNQDKRFFLNQPWACVVVDEAHVLKNQSTRITTIARKLTSSFRIAVTGTPVQNHTREVWSIIGFLFPSVTVRDGDFDGDDPVEAAALCSSMLSQVMLRRTKENLLLGIPPRVDHPVVLLQPTAVQRELLHRMTRSALEESGERGMQGHLTHQRMVASHPLAIQTARGTSNGSSPISSISQKLAAAGITELTWESLVNPSAKMRYLDEVLPKLKEEGHRCLIFSNFSSVIDLLEGFCELRGYAYERLDGSCSRVERELAVLRYNSATSAAFLFLITTPAGGVGITLTGADTVVLFDANFNPQLDRQAADRAHRIGQTREVHVYRLCLENTVEEHIQNVAAFKATLGDAIVNGGCVGSPTSPTSESSSRDTAALSAQAIRDMMTRMLEARQQKQQPSEDDDVVDCDADLLEENDSQLSASDQALVARLMSLQMKPDVVGPSQRNGGGRSVVAVTHNCFVCGHLMHSMQPMYHCSVCPKAYHAGCIGEKKPNPGFSTPRSWSCPRHFCDLCEKAAAQTDGAIFMCDSCPLSYCFDCLPAQYLDLGDDGLAFRYLRRTYEGSEGQEEVKRSSYYFTCARCQSDGQSSTASSSEGSASRSASTVVDSD